MADNIDIPALAQKALAGDGDPIKQAFSTHEPASLEAHNRWLNEIVQWSKEHPSADGATLSVERNMHCHKYDRPIWSDEISQCYAVTERLILNRPVFPDFAKSMVQQGLTNIAGPSHNKELYVEEYDYNKSIDSVGKLLPEDIGNRQ